MQPDPSLKPGDRIPNFLLPDQENARRSFYHELLGQPVLLLACRKLTAGPAHMALTALAQRADDIAELKAQIFAVTASDVLTNFESMKQLSAGFTVFSDPSGQMIGPMMAAAGTERVLETDLHGRYEGAFVQITSLAAVAEIVRHVADKAVCPLVTALWRNHAP